MIAHPAVVVQREAEAQKGLTSELTLQLAATRPGYDALDWTDTEFSPGRVQLARA
jgi:hypothetical protein